MKKLFTLFAAALVMLAASSCEKNEVLPDNTIEGKVITLSATIDNGGTKTSLGDGVPVPESNPVTCSYPVLWSEGDAIAVIQTVNEETKIFKFVLQRGGGTTNGVFNLVEYDECGYTASDFDASKEIKAFYPFAGVWESGTRQSIMYTVPATQNHTIHNDNETSYSTFGNGASPMAAYADNAAAGLTFKNLFGVLKLQLKGTENVKSISLTSNLYLSNYARVSFGVNSVINMDEDDADKSVILSCGEGVALNTETATDFLICVPPGEHNFTITVNSTIGDIPKAYNLTTTQTIEAGVIKKMAVMDFSVAYIENGVYLGDGVALPNGNGGNIIWAPVNCGYEPANGEYKGYPYGKLYQWGRKDGHGYSVDYDASAPEKSDDNPVPANLDADCFYTNWNPTDAEWPAESNPCPQGWRIPTSDELMTLVYELNSESKLSNSQWVGNGAWFYGHIEEPTPSNSKVFFPAAGSHESWRPTITNQNRNNGGTYWSSSLDATSCAIVFSFNHQLNVGLYDQNSKADGNSVRCVKE